jgi:hypothetical protein
MLDWLKGILPEHIHISPKLIVKLNIKINSDNHSTTPVILDGKDLLINDETPQGKLIADKIIEGLPAHMEHNDLLLEDKDLEHFEEVDQIVSTSSYEAELNTFVPMVPKKDLPILETAIVIKIKYDGNESIAHIKSQLIQRFGQRAGMISNLYSAGYFHTLIKPLYESIEAGELAVDEYLEVYEMIVTESPLAVFIGVNATLVKAKKQLMEKIQFNKQADIGYLNIHGIGDNNITLIKTLLSDSDISTLFIEEPTIELIGNSIKATIYF